MQAFGLNQDGKIVPVQGQNGILVLRSGEEIRSSTVPLPHRRELLHSLGSIRYCKAERVRDGMLGTLRIPGKGSQPTPFLTLAFFMTDQTLTLVQDTGNLREWLEKQLPVLQEVCTPEELLLRLLEQAVSEDGYFFGHLEQELERLEDTLLHRTPPHFLETMTAYRRRLSEYAAYYDQLSTIAERMGEQGAEPASGPELPWEVFLHFTERLQNHVQQIKEALHQVRELYQAQQAAQQNRVMGVLTVVTTVFLPLTLLTGWYGMNFANMPELQWQYGYPAVIAAAAVIVVAEVIYFWRKRFF